MLNTFRNLMLIGAYTAFGLLFAVSGHFYTPPPQAKPIVAPTEAQIKEQVKNERKQAAKQSRIRHYVSAARMVYHRLGCNGERNSLDNLTGRTAYELGLSPQLLAAVVFVESSCNPTARSGRDSVGLMQINPRVWGHRNQLTDANFNIHFGARILAGYIHRYGLTEGLHHYNGLGNKSDSYARRVLAAGGIEWPS